MNHMYDRPVGRPPGGPAEPWRPENASPITLRRVATLERRAPRVVDEARRTGVDISYLGISPLFDQPRAYAGPTTDWLICPVSSDVQEIVPRAERQTLQRLLDAGIDFPVTYIAHELPKDRLQLQFTSSQPNLPVAVDSATVATAAGAVPPPKGSVEISERLGRASQQLLTALGKAVPIAGAIVAAPFLLAGAAVAAVSGLDPIVFGVIPAGHPQAGEPAAWYVLARWDW